MALRLTTNPRIDAYIRKVISDARHHAPGVATVIPPLSNAVRARINLAVDRIEVYQRNGKIARTCWVIINGKRYVFTYNYSLGVIDLRLGSLRGAVIFQFDNTTTGAAIAAQAAAL